MYPQQGPWQSEPGPDQYGMTPPPNQQPQYGYQAGYSYQPAGYQPAMYQQGYGVQPGYGYPMAPAPTNGMAIGALVASLLFAPLGIILGHVALSQIKRTGQQGRGLAISGLVIGYVLTVVAIVSWIFLIAVFNSVQNDLEDDYYYSSSGTTSATSVLGSAIA